MKKYNLNLKINQVLPEQANDKIDDILISTARNRKATESYRRASLTPMNPSPLAKAGFFSQVFFCWINVLFNKGYNKILQNND